MSTLPEITEVQRLRLEPGDALVVRVAADEVDMCTADLLKERVRALLGGAPDLPVMVLAAGGSVEVLNSGAPAAAEGQAPGVPA